uniref:Uncharacterized protein n=1 Tax=Anguilla anguilla TaxID=7936 RepID=A0A0E9TPH3_ANGAN
MCKISSPVMDLIQSFSHVANQSFNILKQHSTTSSQASRSLAYNHLSKSI